MTPNYLQKQRELLLRRRKSKQKILASGGQQALSHSHQDLVRIDFALRRIEDNQYGLCCLCGCTIDTRRLAIIPETPLCVECAKANHQ